jgi:hypothetical protein
VTAQGHPRATFYRAIERGQLAVAETTLREMGRITLIEALQLTALIAVKDPRRHARVSARWLARYLAANQGATIDESRTWSARSSRSAATVTTPPIQPCWAWANMRPGDRSPAA